MTMWSRDVRFHPWVGSKYKEGIRGKKLLIVGESCYAWPGDQGMQEPLPTHASQLVQERGVPDLLDGYELRFMKNIEATFAWAQPLGSSPLDFWNQVSFYEFVQRPMASSDHRPQAADWKSAWSPFVEITRALRPDGIFIFGFIMWTKLAPEDLGTAVVSKGPPALEMCGYRFADDFSCPAFRMRHPSRGYRANDWAPLAESALEVISRDWRAVLTGTVN